MKAIVLLSGGLDSRLAIRLLQKQGIELEALNFMTIFCTCTARGKKCSEAVSASQELGIPLTTYNATEELMDAVKNPRFGYGRGMNPCIDCRITMLKKTKTHMLKSKASFVVTGEVLGERPMSQRKDAIEKIERESGLEGLILRPLSARLFSPTVPEQKGWVNREGLLDIQGRSRKRQIMLAGELDAGNYPCPAGGCLLTDKEFSRRVKDLINHGQWDLDNAVLLKLGRHFRLSKNCKAIVGRDEEENKRIKELKEENDYLFENLLYPGPTALSKGKSCGRHKKLIAGITASFITKKTRPDKIKVNITRGKNKEILEVLPLKKEETNKYRI